MIDDLERYDRQIRLIGVEGQERLKAAKVFIAGAGGLGSPISIYLAAAGIGNIVLIDKDRVELSNLNRQILHWERDVGKKKTSSAREKLQEINSQLNLKVISSTLDEENVFELVGDADIIIDAMDNYPARYLLNKTALEKGIPFVHGAISGFHGQVTTVLPGRSPCFKCIFKKAPPATTFPVLGFTPGIIGGIQATEALKCITGIGSPLAGRLFLWDGLNSNSETVSVSRDPSCPDCGNDARILGHERYTSR